MESSIFRKKSVAQLVADDDNHPRLRRVLGHWQLTSIGIGSIIGTGIFVLIGEAAHDRTGPAIILSFVVSGLACVLAALCYAEFAAMVPVAGTAYTYAYATLGEIFAWVIGWDLTLEYAVGAATVAHGWSAHFKSFIPLLGLQGIVPARLAGPPVDYVISNGAGPSGFVTTGSVIDLPAVLIVVALTAVLVRGIKQTAVINSVMVVLKLLVVLMVIGIGAFYVHPANWHPFAPFGYSGISVFGHPMLGPTTSTGEPLGMFAGAAIIFFSYIGFDSVSAHSEEAKRPEWDVPFGIIASLIVCTVLYLAVAVVLTGMVPSAQLDREAAVVDAFRRVGLTWMQYLVAGAALIGITSVLLVMLLSQPRLMLALARDGLISKKFFGDIHPKFRTPWKSTMLTGGIVAIAAGFLPLSILAEMTNIGTLFAFSIVCIAVLVMRKAHPKMKRPFRVPGGPIIPILGATICVLLMFSLPLANWWRLIIWFAVGIVLYFTYGRRHALANKSA